MKIGFLLYEYFPFGGLQRDCLNTAKVCAGRGHDVTILTRSWTGDRSDQVQVKLFGRHGRTNYRRNRVWLAQLEGAIPKMELDGLVGFDKLPGLDVYFGADPCFVAKVARTKPGWYRWLPRYRQLAAMEKAVFARGQTTQILQLTPHEIPIYKNYYGTEDRFHLVPAMAPRRSFTEDDRQKMRAQIRQEHRWPEHENLLLFVGSDFKRKGMDRVIRGFASLDLSLRQRSRVVVLGASAPGRFASLARSLGVSDRVHFLGGRKDAPDWMLAADVMLHPAYVETAGAVLVEAVTSGLPVLTTEVCGYAFHIENSGGGMVIPEPFQQGQFNENLGHMLSSAEKQHQMRSSALKYAAHEDLYGCHQRVADIIEATLEKRILSK